jgi:single-strand DNA-binding protein
VYVEGRLQVREYEDKDGSARTSVEVVASKVRFLGRGNNHGEEKRPVPGQPTTKAGQPSAPADDFNQSGDDPPF